MAREGQHSATLTVKGNARSANKEMQALANRQHEFERSIERTNIQLDKQARKMNRAGKAGKAGAGGVSGLTGALVGAGGYVAAAAGAIMMTERFASRMIDFENVTADLRFDLDGITASMDNMATGFEVSRGAALLQSTSLQLTQDQMERLANLTATVADKNKRDLVTSYEAVTTAIAKGNVDRTRALGLNTDNAKLLDEVARATGRSTTQIGLAERQQIAYNEVLRALNEQAKQAGDSQDGLAFSFERLKNKSVDALDAFGQRVNALPQNLADLRDETADLIENGLLALGVESENVADQMENIEGGLELVGRAMIATVTLGASEYIPFLMKWEQHLQTINGLLGDMQQVQVARSGGVLGLGNIRGAAEQLTRTPDALDGVASAWRTLNGAIRQGSEDLNAFLEKARKVQRKGPRTKAKPKQTLDAPVLDIAAERQRIDALRDAELETDIAREQRRAQVVAMQTGSEAQLIAAQESAELRRAELAAERAVRDQDEAALLYAKDVREQVAHEAEIRRIEEAQAARQRADRKRRADLQRQMKLEAAAEKKRKQTAATVVATTRDVNGILSNGAGIAQLAAEASIKSDERRARMAMKFAGYEALTIGVLETIKAGAAFASLNPIQGALHTSAAALAYVKGGLLVSGRLPGAGGGGGGGGGSLGGGGGASMGRGASQPRSAGASRGAGDTPVPASGRSGQQSPAEDPTRRDRARGGPRGGDYIVQISAPVVSAETVEQITRQQRDHARSTGVRVGAA